ncbi:MAG: phosphatase PAP2 family protein, partial [Rhodospirillales bacterium]
MNAAPDETACWQALRALRASGRSRRIATLVDGEPRRFAAFSVALDDLLLDYSRTALTSEIRAALLRLAAARGVAQRRVTAAATVGVLVAVPALKRVSRTSCPWDVVDYGGTVPWVSHWALSVADGGPGHCFPSGQAVAACAFRVPALAWRRQHPGRARVARAAVLAVGALFGAVQVLRGAHYLSHVLWSAWLCAAMAVAVDAARRLQAGFS